MDGAGLLLVLAAIGAAATPVPRARAQARPTPTVYDRSSSTVATIKVSDRDGSPKRAGSGVLINADGEIVTNYHVVEGGTFFDVTLPGQEVAPARPYRCAPDRDLATLRINPPSRAKVANIGKTMPEVGERVYAIGSPMLLEGTITDGIVSSVRLVGESRLIQTTAAVSHGSSGGGLFRSDGALVGITTLTLAEGQSLNFAVPVEDFRLLEACGSFPQLTAEKAASPTETPIQPTPTLSYCPDLERIAAVFGGFLRESALANEQVIAEGRGAPKPNSHHRIALAELRRLAADYSSGRYDLVPRRLAGGFFLTVSELADRYEAMINAMNLAYLYPRSNEALFRAQETLRSFMTAFETCMRSLAALSEDTKAACPNWLDKVK